MIRIVIAGQPVAKGRPRMTRNGHAYTPEKTATWETIAKWEASRQFDGAPLDGALDVSVYAYFAIPESWPAWKKRAAISGSVLHTTKPDVDNLAKCVDAFNGLLWTDDARIASLSVRKSYGPEPRVVVVVTQLETLHSGSRQQAAKKAA